MIAVSRWIDQLKVGDKVLIAPGTSDTVEEIELSRSTQLFKIRLHSRAEPLVFTNNERVTVFI